MGGYSPDESMIDCSPFLWAVKLVQRRCTMRHEEGDATTAWMQRDRGGDEKTRTGDLTPLPYRKKQRQKNPCPGPTCDKQSKTHPQQHIRARVHSAQHSPKPTHRVTVEGGTVPTTNRSNSSSCSFSSILKPPSPSPSSPPTAQAPSVPSPRLP
jgi:hypothetical protein